MAYTKQNFVDGQTLKAEHLNKIEDGIVAAEANAVPTSRTVNGKALNSNITLSASDVGALPNTTVIPDALSDLKADSTHRTVTDTEKSTWNAKANTSDIPTKVSQLTNDKNYLTSYTETDPTVPSWAKASTKPSYTKGEVGLGNVDNVKQYSASNPPPYPVTKINNKTGTVTLSASDVGADATGTASSAVFAHNTNTSAHADIREQISQLSSEKVDKTSLTLGVHTDGLLYVFSDGQPIGNGVSFPSQLGDVYGNVDSGNNIVLQGDLADGTYSVKYEMDDGSTVAIGNLVLDSNVYYTVTKNLTNCAINNSATQVAKGNSYFATISANDGYELKSVTVTMGGSAVSVTNGVINIANVTGNIVINAVAEEKASEPTNLFNPATATYNARLGSDSTVRTGCNGAVVTDFIDVTNIHEIGFEGTFAMNTSNTAVKYGKVCAYDANGTPVYAGITMSGNPDDTNYIYSVDILRNNYPSATQIRVCLSITADTAITAADVTDVKILVVK